jgi:tetratricopeptide (TPR) repeat protein
MKCYRETLRVERAALGPNHSDIIFTLQHTAQVHQRRGELDDALDCYREVLRIQRRNLSENDPSIARTLNSIANVHLQNGNTIGVVGSMSKAARIMNRAGRSDEELRLSGFDLYGFAILHPVSAAAA